MNNIIYQKDKFLKIFLIISFISCWVSISTTTEDIYKILQIYKLNIADPETPNIQPDFNEIINALRQSIIFIIFPILLILNFFKFNKQNFKDNFPFFCLFLYFILQLPGLILTQNSYLNIGFVFSSLNILLILNLANKLFNTKTFKIFIYINLFFLILIIYLNKSVFINFWDSGYGGALYSYRDHLGEFFLDKTSPRATGTARTILILYIILILVFKNFFYNHKIFNYLFYLPFASIIILFQSRGVYVLLIVYLIFNFFSKKNENIFKYVITYIIIPIILSITLVYLKNYDYITGNKELLEEGETIYRALQQSGVRPIDPESFSSGRVNDWRELLSKYKKEFKYYGYGSQADRYLINQSASNGIIHALTSSGIIGIIFYLLFNLFCLYKVFNNLVLKHKKNSRENELSSIIILLILLRSLIESSFSVFGIDLILICTFYTYLSKNDLLVKYGN